MRRDLGVFAGSAGVLGLVVTGTGVFGVGASTIGASDLISCLGA